MVQCCECKLVNLRYSSDDKMYNYCREGEMSKKALKKQQKEAEKAARKAQKQEENKENVNRWALQKHFENMSMQEIFKVVKN